MKPPTDFKWLAIRKVIPAHLVLPEPKEMKKARKERQEKRVKPVFFPGAIAKYNKRMQRARQSNERPNWRQKTLRLYQRRVNLKLLPKMQRLNGWLPACLQMKVVFCASC